MILIKFFTGFFLIFLAPPILIFTHFKNLKPYLCLAWSCLFSFSLCWFLFFFSFYLNLNGLQLVLVILILYLVFHWRHKPSSDLRPPNAKFNALDPVTLFLLVVTLTPVFLKTGEIFTSWDAVVSWNRWAMELSKNVYQPMNSAYPILFPAVWSLFYKIQGTAEIWVTIKTTLFVVPVYVMLILTSLYQQTRNRIFLVIILFIGPYYYFKPFVDGYMDFPAMLLGLLALTMLKAYELSQTELERANNLYAALLFAGLSSITKQAGLAFLACVILYIVLFARKHVGARRVFWAILLISCSFFVSYLCLYRMYYEDPFANLDKLQALAYKRNFIRFELLPVLKNLFHHFFIHWIMLIPVSLLFLASVFSLRKEARSREPLLFLCFIFFVLGFFSWVKYFSYDYRNALSVISFLIVSGAGMIGVFLTGGTERDKRGHAISGIGAKLKEGVNHSFARIKYLVFPSALVLFFLLSRSDAFLIRHQENQQKYVGRPNLAKKMAALLEDQPPCVIVVTNEQPTKYNYFCRKYFERIIKTRGSLLDYKNDYYSKAASCPYGYYWASMSPEKDILEQVASLEKDRKIIRVDTEYYIYFVPPPLQN